MGCKQTLSRYSPQCVVGLSLDGIAEPERTQFGCVAENLGRVTEIRPSIQNSYRGELHNVSVRQGGIQAMLLCGMFLYVCVCVRAGVHARLLMCECHECG